MSAERGPDSQRWIACVVVALATLLAPRCSLGQISSSSSGNSQDALNVAADWPNVGSTAGGYLPVSVTLTNTRGTPGPRELRVSIRNRAFPGGIEISQRITLEGAKPVRIPLALPLTTPNLWCELRIHEQGAELDKLRLSGIGGGGGWWRGEAPNTLLIARATPDWRAYQQAVSIMSGQGPNPSQIHLTPDRIPTRWIELTAFDLALTSYSELERMPDEARTVLLAWTMAGGNLCVFGVATDQDRDNLDRLLDLNHRAPVGAPWRQPRPEDRQAFAGVASSGGRAAINSTAWRAEAASRLKNQGPEAYRAYCTQIINQFGSVVSSAGDQNNLAWTCVLGPDAVPELSRVVWLAERAVTNSGRSAAYLNTHGVALYRAGQFQEAITKLNQSMVAHRAGGIPEDWFFMAMAHHKLGNADEAKRWLDQAMRATGPARGATIEQTLFRREAEALFNATSASDSSAQPQAKYAETKPAGVDATKPDDPDTQATTTTSKPALPTTSPFEFRAFGMGQLVRMSAADPFAGTDTDWSWLFQTLGSGRMKWSERHGMTARAGNPDFWNFLVPDVGRAPVGAFQVLITVFALVIGPANYFLFRRQRRLYLLMMTVPALALLTSGLLFGYSLLSDGLGVRTRVRSVTVLDQERGEGVTWSRISYYAGLTPAGGLRFSPDTAVYPLVSEDGNSSFRFVDWTQEQHLSSGWLRSRTPTQLLAITHRAMGGQLAVASDGNSAVRVTNNLGASVRLLVLADAEGRLYTGENLAPGARVLLTPAEGNEQVSADVRTLVQAQQLVVPDELKELATWYGPFPWSGRRATAGLSATSSSSLLEDTLRQLTGGAAQFASVLGPHRYVAVTERPAFVELGAPHTEDAASLYVILGSY